MNLSTKQKQSHRHREQTYGCQGGERMDRESGVSMCKLTFRKDKKEGPAIQHKEIYSISSDKPYGKEHKKERIYMYI